MNRSFIFSICGGLIGGLIGLLITSTTPSNTPPKELQTVSSDQNLTDEQIYKFNCKPIMNSDILDAEDPEEYKDELIAFVGTIVDVEEIENEYNYYVSDVELSDGGGLWKATFADKFSIGNMIIIYGSNAVRDDDAVSIDPKYMEIYKQ